jgi:CheY-like chemotaxis protein
MVGVKRILLVEDDVDDQLFFRQILEEIISTPILEVASNGLSAMKLLLGAQQLPDLIFMDMNMPVMNGIDFLREISKHRPLRHIPVVVLSTSADYVEEAAALGARAYVQKPNSAKGFMQKILWVIEADLGATSNGKVNTPLIV